jgi:hypothetical protein
VSFDSSSIARSAAARLAAYTRVMPFSTCAHVGARSGASQPACSPRLVTPKPPQEAHTRAPGGAAECSGRAPRFLGSAGRQAGRGNAARLRLVHGVLAQLVPHERLDVLHQLHVILRARHSAKTGVRRPPFVASPLPRRHQRSAKGRFCPPTACSEFPRSSTAGNCPQNSAWAAASHSPMGSTAWCAE